MNLYLNAAAGPYEVGRQAMLQASIGVTFSLAALSVVGLVLVVSWAVSLVRPKAEEPKEEPTSDQDRVEVSARMQ